jgi:urease accessory protein
MRAAGAMARAAVRLQPGDPRVAGDTVRLPFDDRHRRRLVVRTAAGERVLIDLPEAVRLGHGDRLLLDDGGVLGIEAEPEPVADLFAPDLVRLAWHLGNRHTPTAILPDRLRIRRDHVLEAMAARLGARVEQAEAPFDPEAGAYHDGGGHGHHHD